jgi:hypothetical protein
MNGRDQLGQGYGRELLKRPEPNAGCHAIEDEEEEEEENCFQN